MNNRIEDIINYLQITDRIYTSGQPEKEHFEQIHRQGIKTVINLALPSSENAIPEEAAIVTGLGMTYIQIPVDFSSPQEEDLQKFFLAMKLGLGKPVLIHCVLNMRASAFIYLYRINVLNESQEEAEKDLQGIWDPDPVWAEFISNNLHRKDSWPE